MYIPQNLLEIKNYRPAVLRTGKEWYVEYYVFDPAKGRQTRKKYMLNHISKISERRKFAGEMIKRINSELERGWNPAHKEENIKYSTPLATLINQFMKNLQSRLAESDLRESTVISYVSKMKNLLVYMEEKKMNKLPVSQFNREVIQAFVEAMHQPRENRARTRDNYLKTIRIFCNWLIDKGYMLKNHANDIPILGKASRGPKIRRSIGPDMRSRISEYLAAENKHFLLVCELIYFCMIRPKELTFIRISHINLQNCTLFIPAEFSKNKKDGVVTLPVTVVELMRELEIDKYPPYYYLFSDGFKPGNTYRRQKQFNDFFRRKLAPALSLPLSVQLYSFKDAGITDMIRETGDMIAVRDQARHHDLSITNIYIPFDMVKGNDLLKKDSRKF